MVDFRPFAFLLSYLVNLNVLIGELLVTNNELLEHRLLIHQSLIDIQRLRLFTKARSAPVVFLSLIAWLSLPSSL